MTQTQDAGTHSWSPVGCGSTPAEKPVLPATCVEGADQAPPARRPSPRGRRQSLRKRLFHWTQN